MLQQLSNFFNKNGAVVIKNELIKEYSNRTIKDMFQRLGELVIFLDPLYMKHDAVLFNERLKAGFIKESDILKFNPKDILREVYDYTVNGKGKSNKALSFELLELFNPEEDELITEINKKVSASVNDYVTKLIYKILTTYRLITKRQTFKHFTFNTLFESLDKSFCSNDYDEGNDIVYYIEDNKVYCFSLQHLLLHKITINPYTDNLFSDDFISFLAKFHKKVPKIEAMIEIKQETDEEKENARQQWIQEEENALIVLKQMDKDKENLVDFIYNAYPYLDYTVNDAFVKKIIKDSLTKLSTSDVKEIVNALLKINKRISAIRKNSKENSQEQIAYIIKRFLRTIIQNEETSYRIKMLEKVKENKDDFTWYWNSKLIDYRKEKIDKEKHKEVPSILESLYTDLNEMEKEIVREQVPGTREYYHEFITNGDSLTNSIHNQV